MQIFNYSENDDEVKGQGEAVTVIYMIIMTISTIRTTCLTKPPWEVTSSSLLCSHDVIGLLHMLVAEPFALVASAWL